MLILCIFVHALCSFNLREYFFFYSSLFPILRVFVGKNLNFQLINKHFENGQKVEDRIRTRSLTSSNLGKRKSSLIE